MWQSVLIYWYMWITKQDSLFFEKVADAVPISCRPVHEMINIRFEAAWNGSRFFPTVCAKSQQQLGFKDLGLNHCSFSRNLLPLILVFFVLKQSEL